MRELHAHGGLGVDGFLHQVLQTYNNFIGLLRDTEGAGEKQN